MQASDVMTRDVATVRPDTPIAAAIAKMVELRISGLPVLDPSGRLVGILTEGDLLRRLELGTVKQRPAWLKFLRGPDAAAGDYVRDGTMLVGDIMTPEPATVASTVMLDEVVAVMEQAKVRRVPVIEAHKLVGIVSRADLVRALGQVMAGPTAAPEGDLGIRAAILAELSGQGWFRNTNIGITVRHGAVRLEGMAQSESVRMAVRVAAERVPGVVSIDNAMGVLDPMLSSTGI